MAKGYVDSDGHVMENERELNEFIEPPFNQRYISPIVAEPGWLSHSQRATARAGNLRSDRGP